MTNAEKWKFWNRDSFSPDIFIEWSWWMLVSSVLQRRVWYGNDTYPLYPNMYTLFVAPPGIGKGLQLDQIKDFMEYHKLNTVSEEEVLLSKHLGKIKSNLLFPVASDSTTFESFLEETHLATVTFRRPSGAVYIHASQTFILDEFESIFKQHAEDMAVYLRTAWNCKDYTRRTKNSGVFIIKNPCVSVLGGVTPDAMMALTRKEIVSNGFTSRAILVYARRNRFTDIELPKPDDVQMRVRDELRAWIKHLSTVYGCCQYTEEAKDVLRAYLRGPKWRVNPAAKLDEYYSRKITNMNKLVMCMHYSEPGHEELVGPETIHRCIDLFDRTEVNMHLALAGGGRNELGDVAKKVLDYVMQRPTGVRFQTILVHFYEHGTKDELEQVLQVLQAQGAVLHDHNAGLYKPTMGNI